MENYFWLFEREMRMKENSEAKMNERKKETQVAFTDFQSGRGRQGTKECGWSKEVKMVLS